MKSKQLRYSRMKFYLSKLKTNRDKYYIWKLSNECKDFIENMGYTVKPYLFEIKTRRIPWAKTQILKEIHYKNREGKISYVRKLNSEEMEILKENNINFTIAKYLIKDKTKIIN